MPDPVEPARLVATETDRGATRVGFPRGKIDGIAVRELYELAMSLTDRPHPKLLVDLSGVDMISSGAVGILLAIRKKYLQYGGQLHIAAAAPMVLQSLQVMNLHRVLQIYDTVDAAAAGFR